MKHTIPFFALALAAVPLAAQDAPTSPGTPGAPAATPGARPSLSPGGSQAATSSPGRIQTLFTNLPGSPTSDVPGLAPAKFQPSTTLTTVFERPWTSPNGLHYVIQAETDLPTTEDEVLLLNGAVVGREGTPAPFAPGQNWGLIDVRLGINDSGEYAFCTNVGPTTTNDDYVVKVSAGPTYTVFAQEGAAISALPGATWDDTTDSVYLLADGRVGCLGDGIDGAGVVTTTDDEIVVIDNVIVAREGITVPGNQDAGGTATWENFDFEDTWVDPTGTHVLILGDLLGSTNDDVLVYDGNVVLQEGVIIAGSGFASPISSGGVTHMTMASNGDWYARGDNADGQDWIVRNGAVLASTGDALGNAGEQVFLESPIDGAQETPPSGSPATGTGRFLIDTSSNTLRYHITFTGLTGVENAAHIHGFAGPGVPAGILYALPLGTPKVGTITYLESEEAGLLAGLAYVNIHTDLFPGGEIRGQVLVSVEEWAGPTGTTETFYAIAGNGSGDWVAMGTTNAPDAANGVVVLNGQNVLVRENDPIDVDGNGLYDDNAFFRTFGNDDLALLNDGTVLFTATIQDAAGAQTGQGLFRRSGGNLQRAFCFGDGSGTACPCGNNSVAGGMAGCLNSLGMGGRLDTTGIASLSADSLVLTGQDMPDSSALYFQGTSKQAAGAGATFGDGLRCAGGSVVRLGIKFNVGGTSQYPATGDLSVSVRGLVTVPGERTYQCWYRNAAAFCTADTFNLTNGIAVTWGI
jgi:hypothetical protein